MRDAVAASRRGAIQASLVLLLVVIMPVRARSDVIDIPAQSLAAAIDAFCAATGLEVYYDGAAALGQRSTPVSGEHPPERALIALLAGTDLVPLRARHGAYLLFNPGDEAARSLAAARAAQDARYARYFAIVQQAVSQSLCRTAAMNRRRGRVVIRLWIDPRGALRRIETDQDGAADAGQADLQEWLRDVRLPEPPQQMPQPVTIALLPGKALVPDHCLSTASAPGGR